MSCENVQDRISSLLDRRLSSKEQEIVLAHLDACRECGAEFETVQSLRATLRKMNAPAMPHRLAERLRALASDERVRQLTRTSLSARALIWFSRIELMLENMMRPLALPLAGGTLSAFVLFGLLVSTLSFQHNFSDDLPTAIFTIPDGKVVDWYQDLPRLQPVSIAIASDDTIVDLTIDDRGRVQDYSVIRGQETPEIRNFILFSKFTPATFFGMPTWGQRTVVFPRRGLRG